MKFMLDTDSVSFTFEAKVTSLTGSLNAIPPSCASAPSPSLS